MTTSTPTEVEKGEPGSKTPIAIVGGGITGLFCAYVLASKGHRVELFESSDQFGGRIRSFLLRRELMEQCVLNERNRKPHPIKDGAVITELAVNNGEYENLEFCAEFGPMRIELDVQVLLKFLLTYLKIGDDPDRSANTTSGTDLSEEQQKQNAATTLKAAHLEPFPSFSSPTSEADPLYQLRPDEEGKNPLELMGLALCRAIVHISIDEDHFTSDDETKYDQSGDPEPNGYKQKREALINSLRDAAALQEPIGPTFDKWAKTLREDDYWVIAKYGRILIGDADTPVPLHAMGFWNLMSIYLSHNALTKVRDLGTFYHLLPENPNAAHWLTWQLRQLSISDQLQGIYGGMQAITKNLLDDKMDYKGDGATPSKGGTCTVKGITIPMHLNAHVERVDKEDDGLHLRLESEQVYPDDGTAYSRVILALPKAPVHELVMASEKLKLTHNRRAGGDNLKLPEMLDSSFGFPMVKAFFVVRDRWWEEAKRANWFATRFPTREVHYWKSRDPKSRRGMVMLYTDRPASSFWANYVPAGRQNDVEELCVPDGQQDENREMIRARLKQRLVQYINENHVPDITEADIIWCAIMDWGRQPYGAGNHAWRPERKFWETMADLADITFEEGTGGPHVHICGEAFTDYTGFIEGSLRSATYTLTKILRNDQKGTTADVLKDILGVLDVSPDLLKVALSDTKQEDGQTKQEDSQPTPREHDYLEDLRSWVDNLDSCLVTND
jgi:hypothetical protein